MKTKRFVFISFILLTPSMQAKQAASSAPSSEPVRKVGRPRRGTESERRDALFAAATRVFLKEGYGLASIDKVAAEAGASTRTIYQHFENKADLLVAVIGRLIERNMGAVLIEPELLALPVEEGLTLIGNGLLEHFQDEESRALFQLIAMEAHRFPELAQMVRSRAKQRIQQAIERYLRNQCASGVLQMDDPAEMVHLFVHMIIGEVRESMLFCATDAAYSFDAAAHVKRVVDVFLNGCRAAAPNNKKSLSAPVRRPRRSSL